MNKEHWLSGPEAPLPEILNRRENRVRRQGELLEHPSASLVCLTLNIAGPQKTNPLIALAYRAGRDALIRKLQLAALPLLREEHWDGAPGYEGFFLVEGAPEALKGLTLSLEASHPLGRLFDLDVLSPSKEKLSRARFGQPERPCLICGGPAFLCARSRAHSAKEVYGQAMAILTDFAADAFSERIAALFTKGMLYEVMTTPKPGLVDRHHPGAHRDMDVDLFVESTDALRPYFARCARLGFAWEGTAEGLFSRLRLLGLEAEAEMKKATCGVNTHKGLIFSGGILCAACGRSYGESGAVSLPLLSSLCREMLISLEEDFDALSLRPPASHGERLYREYGLRGIRGEAMEGFPTLFEQGFPLFCRLRAMGLSHFRSGRITLLALMAESEDTNVITRSDYPTYLLLKEKLGAFLKANPPGTFDELPVLLALDRWFLERNISPGGSADLLALVYFLAFLTEAQEQTGGFFL